MPAPNTAYLNNSNALRMDEEDTIGTIITSFDALVAAYIYGAADIKALFYLDAIVEVQITDDAGTLIQKGFIGLVLINSFNYKHHAVARRFKGALPVFNDVDSLVADYVALNDGGLNTLGDTANISVVFALNDEFNATLTANFLSAFYDASTTHGYAVRHSRYDSLGSLIDTNDNHVNSGSLAAGASANISVPLSFGSLTGATEIHIYRSFIINPEGTYYSPQQIQVTRQLVNAQLNQNASGIYATSDRPLLASYIYQFDYYDNFDLASGSSTIPAGGMQGSYFQPIFANTGYGPSPINILNHEVFAANNGNPYVF